MPDRGGPARFAPLAPGADPTDHPGVGGGLGLLAPLGEPTVRGEPPVAPDVLPAAETAFPVAARRAACGRERALPRAPRGRPRFTARWTGLDESEESSLRAFLVATCGNGLDGFTLRPDGEGSTPIAVRARAAYAASRLPGGVFAVELPVEALHREAET